MSMVPSPLNSIPFLLDHISPEQNVNIAWTPFLFTLCSRNVCTPYVLLPIRSCYVRTLSLCPRHKTWTSREQNVNALATWNKAWTKRQRNMEQNVIIMRTWYMVH